MRLPRALLMVASFPWQFRWCSSSSSCWVRQTVHTWASLQYPAVRSSRHVPRSCRTRSRAGEVSAPVDRNCWALPPTSWSHVHISHVPCHRTLCHMPHQLDVVVLSFVAVSAGMDDHLRAGTPSRYVTKPMRSTQPCTPLGSVNWVPALIRWGKDRNVTSAG